MDDASGSGYLCLGGAGQREVLARVVGKDCSIDLLIDDLREELRSRPYELVSVAGGWQHRTRSSYAETIRASQAPTRSATAALSEFEAMVLMSIAYFQPVTRSELSKIFGKEVSRDVIGSLRSAGFVASGPRSPTPGAPYTYVTTKHFLSAFGMETLRDLPDMEALEDAGLLSRNRAKSKNRCQLNQTMTTWWISHVARSLYCPTLLLSRARSKDGSGP
jgi:segregation and condensation protein B